MIRNIKILLFLIALYGGMVFYASAAVAQESPVPQAAQKPVAQNGAWITRCQGEDSGNSQPCEIFQRLLVRDTGQRIAEFAVGYPEGGQGNARGVAVLPLGIILDEDISMQIDDGARFSFKVRYCTQSGCFAFLDLNPEIVDMMRKGGEATFYFHILNGEPMAINLSLSGFTKALETL